MTLVTVTLMTSILISFVLLIQGIEMLLISRKSEFRDIWSYNNLKRDFSIGLPLPQRLINFLFSDKSFQYLVWSQILLSVFGLFYAEIALFAGLFVIQLLICIRFRGTFNGGSDMMTFVILTGVLISLFGKSGQQNLGFIYIAIHTLYSYFKAGFVKILQPDWRRGLALPAFFERSQYADVRVLGSWLRKKPTLSLTLCWMAVLFELSSVVLLFFPGFAILYFVCAAIFHFLIFMTFGLNRFFWNWMAAWPAVIFTLSLYLQELK